MADDIIAESAAPSTRRSFLTRLSALGLVASCSRSGHNDVPGEFPFVNHGFGHGQKGAIGVLVVE